MRTATDTTPAALRAASEPAGLRLTASEPVELHAAEAGPDGKPALRRFSMVAYTGAAMSVDGFWSPVVVDLSGLSVPRQTLPVFRGHDPSQVVAHTDGVDVLAQKLKASGLMSGVGEAAREVLALAANGFPWQASIGASIERREFVEAGQTVKVNGRNFTGPLIVARQATLKEISFVPIGADGATSAAVAAQPGGDTIMTFEQWLAAKQFDPAKLNDVQTAALRAAWQAEQRPPAPTPAPVPTPPPVQAQPAGPSSFEAKMAAIEAEDRRVQYVQEATAAAAERHIGNPEKIKQLRELCASAVADKNTDARAFDLALLRLDRTIGPVIISAQEQRLNDDVLEAAVCLSHKLPGVEKKYGERTLEAAHKHFRRGIGLRELLVIAAERNAGYRGSSRDDVALCRAAFPRRGEGQTLLAAGPSTISVPGILSNVANKFLEAGFLNTEQSWREVSRVKPANDFKEMSSYRLTGSNKFEKVAPGGEIKHGTLGELTYGNKVDTYGKMLGIDRRDIRNDDLGAFTGAASELSRGAGDSLNEVWYTEFLDDSTFFPTDKSKANYDDGATDSVLSLAGLENADAIFAAQTKPDATPLGVMPAILFVPRGLRATALTLMASTQVVGQGASAAAVPDRNPWAGMFRVVSSVYLTYTALGGSATAWYLLADPNNVAVMEVAFLDGMETPTVETGDFDFDRLGLAMRAWMDFGCRKQEYRGGVKLKGAA